jgi:hypothetical protein
MDNKTIFTKTAKGVGEAVGKTRALSRDLRIVLKEVDGKTSFEKLLDKISGLSEAKLHAALNKLSTEDYIREFVAPTFEDDSLDFITIIPLPTKTERAPGQRTRINEALRLQLEARARVEVEAYERLEREQNERERRGEDDYARRAQEKEAARAAQQQAMKEAQEAARIEAEERARQKIEQQAQQEAEQRVRHDAAEAARRKAELQARTAIEEQKRREAEEQVRQAAEVQARQAAEEKYRLEAEAKAKQDAEEKNRRDAELQAKKALEDQARRRAEEQASRDAEEQVRLIAQQQALEDAAQQARREADEQARKEAEQAAHREAGEQARRTDEEADEEAKKEAEERRRKLAVEHRAKRDAEVRAKRELEQQARREEEERVRQETEEKSRREAEERRRQALEQQARLEGEERARQEAQEKSRREAEEKSRREVAALADKSAEEEIRREFEELARQQAEVESRKKAEQARRQIEELTQRKAEAKEKKAEEERTRRESDKAEARREADVRAKQEVEQWMREAAKEKAGLNSSEKMKPEPEEQFEDDIEELAAQDEAARIEQDDREYEEQDEQEPIEAGAEKKSSFKKGQTPYRAPVKWGKPATLVLSLSIVAGLGLIHVMPFDSKTALFEKAATAQFQRPVKIGKVYLSLLPQPQWRLEDVSIGSDKQITVSQIKAAIVLSSLYRDELTFKSVELQSPVFSEQALEWLLFGQPQQQHFTVSLISASNATLASKKIGLPRFNAAADIGADGSWDTITVDSLDRKTRVQLRPGGETIQVEMSADSFEMPFGSTLRLDEFIAKGTARRNELAISDFSGRVYDGILTGSAKLQWRAGWSMKGDLQAKLIDATQLAPTLLQTGKLAGSATYAFQAEHADQLFSVPRMEGSFVVQNGTLLGVDFAKILRGANSAGTSLFAELTGTFVQESGKTQLQNVYLNAGLLSVTGGADMDKSENLNGRFVVELKSPTQQTRSSLAVAGTLTQPQFDR